MKNTENCKNMNAEDLTAEENATVIEESDDNSSMPSLLTKMIRQYIALYRIDTEDKKEISFDIDNNIVYEDGSKVLNDEDYSVTLIDGKLIIKKAQVNSSGEYVQNIVFSTVYEADCDQLLYAGNNLNLYYMQDKNVICINLEGEKIFNSEAYLVDDQFGGYVIAKNIIDIAVKIS